MEITSCDAGLATDSDWSIVLTCLLLPQRDLQYIPNARHCVKSIATKVTIAARRMAGIMRASRREVEEDGN